MNPLISLFETQFNPETKILVIGDLILDEYLFGDVDRISPEAPIPIVHLQSQEDFRLGGAANVALNLSSLGAQVVLMGGIGQDLQGEVLKKLLLQKKIGHHLIPLNRPTTWKRRVLGQNKQMLRIDKENNQPLSKEEETSLKLACLQELAQIQLLILSDYGKGLLTPTFLQFVIQEAQRRQLKILVDPKGKNYQKYQGASVLTPNKKEAEDATQMLLDPQKKQELEVCAQKLMDLAQLEAAIITLGKDGVCLKEKDRELILSPARARSVYDITGAGDTFIACLGYALANRYSYLDAVNLANIAAGIKVAKQGTKEVTRDEILAELRQKPFFTKKIFKAPSLLQDLLHNVSNTTFVLLQQKNVTLELVRFLQQLPGESLGIILWKSSDPDLATEEMMELFASLEAVRWVTSTHTLDSLFSLKIQHFYYEEALSLPKKLPEFWTPFALNSKMP